MTRELIVSGKIIAKLRKRATVFLSQAENLINSREYDIACFSAEQAAQLYLKSLVLELFGEIPKTHSIRSLLGHLAYRLYREGYEEESRKINQFATDKREILIILEDAYIDARYGVRSFTQHEAKKSIEIVRELIELLKNIESAVWKKKPNNPGYAGWIISLLQEWRKYTTLITKAVRKILPDAKVYVFGGAAENRLTVLSDVDILIVVDKEMTDQEKRKIKTRILKEAENYGFLWYYPIELHVIHRSEIERYKKYSKLVEIT